jgi:peptidoglycan-N-acetylmuramic acid deacetylase
MKRITKKSKKLIIGIILVSLLCCIGIMEFASEGILSTSASTGLSNTKIGWGIKREDNHEQPDLGSKNKELITKYNGIALGNSEQKYIYLTFDLGYEAGYTEKILDALKENEVQATFFVTAHYVNSASDILQRMIDEGHIVGNHTCNHYSMPDLSDEEIQTEVMKLHQTIYEKYGYEMKYIRPPKGEFSERTLSICESLGYKTVMWSFAYVDWDEDNQPSTDEAIDKIMSNLHNGEVMLLHATSKTNAEIMSQLLQKIKEEGYEFRSIDDFVQ